tara:strand:- start:6172 stop:6699 length:528 start_codon:yes stop_codon:yes gene_type:complete
MSSLVTTAAPINYNENNYQKKSAPKNQTYKNKEISKKINKSTLEELYKPESDDELDNMGDFQPVQKPIQNTEIKEDEPVNTSDFSKLQNSYMNDYYQQYISNFNNSNQDTSTSVNINRDINNDLLKKLDNILFLLEEQRESEKHLITEELILYVFLGVFIIYVLDCFVKAGKYVR